MRVLCYTQDRIFWLQIIQNLASKKYLSSENVDSLRVNGVIILENLRIRDKYTYRYRNSKYMSSISTDPYKPL